MITSILMCGVGGQGTVLSSDIVCEVALKSGFDAKKSEIHGMAQRGGSVVSHVRFGDNVFSPVIPYGSADLVVSFEYMEFLRYMEYANKSTILVVNENKIFPLAVASGKEVYPEGEVKKHFKYFKKVEYVNALEIARKAGNLKVAGMVLVGALAKNLPFSKEIWEEVISDKVPQKTVKTNIDAFNLGMGCQV